MPKLRVLIADDDPIIRLDLKQMLENLEYEVVAEAGDGKQAVELAREAPTACLGPDWPIGKRSRRAAQWIARPPASPSETTTHCRNKERL